MHTATTRWIGGVVTLVGLIAAQGAVAAYGVTSNCYAHIDGTNIGQFHEFDNVAQPSTNCTAATADGNVQAGAKASSSLADGKLRVSSNSQAYVFYPPGESSGTTTFASGMAIAKFDDVAHTALITQPTLFQVALEVQGALSGDPVATRNGSSTIALAAELFASGGNARGGGGATVNYQNDLHGLGVNDAPSLIFEKSDNIDVISMTLADIHFIVHADIVVNPDTDEDGNPLPTSVPVSISGSLGSDTSMHPLNFYGQTTLLGRAADFSHTATLSIHIAGGLGFTSDSGVLLTQAVPLPAPLALLAAPVVMIARRRATA